MSLHPSFQTPQTSGKAPVIRHRKRPFGLRMILFLLTVQALLGLLLAMLVGLGAIVSPDEFWTMASDLYDLVEPSVLMVLTAVVLVGLWRYRMWGWYGMMVLLAYYTASDAIGYFVGDPDYVSMLLNVVMVFYLNQREVRDLFAAPAAAEVSG